MWGERIWNYFPQDQGDMSDKIKWAPYKVDADWAGIDLANQNNLKVKVKLCMSSKLSGVV